MERFTRQAKREKRGEPLAVRMRPTTLEGFFGQQHLVGPGKLLRRAIADDRFPSLVLWGPPGCGKTTLARIVAERTGARFETLSAVGSGVKEMRELIRQAAERRDVYGKRTILFIDEIHRYNKAQQDGLLPHVEAGTVVLIGATTENPSFEVIPALLSRTRVLRLEGLEGADLVRVLERAVAEDAVLAAAGVRLSPEMLALIAEAAQGDARRALTTLEIVSDQAGQGGEATRELVEQALQQKTLLYDKGGEEHYNVISALIKSMRASDADASVYWMTRMLEAGEDPIFIVRRMVIFASEDVVNADPQALVLATAALQAVRLVGLPEGVLPMTQACTYLATAPKSNAVLRAYTAARGDVRQHGPLPVPTHLRNAPTRLMKDLGYGRGYKYPHDFDGAYVEQACLPDELDGRVYYAPPSGAPGGRGPRRGEDSDPKR